MEELKVVENSRIQGQKILKELIKLQEKDLGIQKVTGKGLLLNLQLEEEVVTKVIERLGINRVVVIPE